MGFLIFRCVRNVHTSNYLRGGESLIAIEKELRPILIMSLNDTHEQVFNHFTLLSGLSIFLAGVNLPPNANLTVYESYA